jgi:hypothetical protein
LKKCAFLKEEAVLIVHFKIWLFLSFNYLLLLVLAFLLASPYLFFDTALEGKCFIFLKLRFLPVFLRLFDPSDPFE